MQFYFSILYIEISASNEVYSIFENYIEIIRTSYFYAEILPYRDFRVDSAG